MGMDLPVLDIVNYEEPNGSFEVVSMPDSEDCTECCANCQHMLLPKRADYSRGGCETTWMEGFVCTAFADEGIAMWMIGCDEHTAHCESFCDRKHKVPILSRSVGEERTGGDKDG